LSPGSPKAKSFYLQRLFLLDSLLLESSSPTNSQASDIVLDQLESSESPASLDNVMHTPLTDDIPVRIQALEVTPKLASITLDDICKAQTADNSLQPVIQDLSDQVQPPHSGIYPVEAVPMGLTDRSYKKAFSTGSSTTRMVVLTSYKYSYRRNSVVRTSNGFTPISDISGK